MCLKVFLANFLSITQMGSECQMPVYILLVMPVLSEEMVKTINMGLTLKVTYKPETEACLSHKLPSLR